MIYSAVVYYVDPILVIIFAVDGLIWIGLPLIAVCLALLLVGLYTERSIRTALMLLGWSIAIVFLAMVAIPANAFLQDHAVENAKVYSEKIDGLLEEYRRDHGAYPSSLDQIPSAPPMPRLLRRNDYYSDGETYSLDFQVPGGLLDRWHYTSETHQWNRKRYQTLTKDADERKRDLWRVFASWSD